MGRRHSKYPQREIAILRFFETFRRTLSLPPSHSGCCLSITSTQTDRFEYSHEVISVLISLW